MAISSVRLILIVAGTAAYLGVAVLGWGGFLAFFSHPALIVLALALFRVVRRGSFRRRKPEVGGARGSWQPLGARTQFGADYDAYRARTSRLIPGLY
jgi:hypothetical protein